MIVCFIIISIGNVLYALTNENYEINPFNNQFADPTLEKISEVKGKQNMIDPQY